MAINKIIQDCIIQDGETATYRCDDGYKLEGQDNDDDRVDLTCVANGTHAMWDGPQPRCERKYTSSNKRYYV